MVIKNIDSQLNFSYPGATKTFLSHYGVLGMHWGIRKDKQFSSGGRIKKGTSVSRVSKTEKETNEGSTYAIINSKFGSCPDAEKRFISGWIKDKPDSKLYQIDMKLKIDLILPSMQEKGRVFVEDILSNKKLSAKLVEASDAFLGDRANKTLAKNRKEAMDAAAKLKTIEIDPTKTGFEAIKDPNLRTAYTAFTQALNDKEIRGAYIGSLSKKGFNAVSDDLMDYDIKNLMYSQRRTFAENRSNKAGIIGGTIGAGIGIAASVATGISALAPALGVAGIFIASVLAGNSNAKRLPDDKSAYSSSSVIIFDRGKSLDIVRTKEYLPSNN